MEVSNRENIGFEFQIRCKRYRNMENIKSMLRLLALILVSACIAACGNPLIRVENRSAVTLESVRVHFPSQTEEYGTIPPNTATEYRNIQQAYGTPYIEATVAGQPAFLRPIDHVGDKLLGAGKYTYAITVNELAESPNDRLRLEFVRN